jgi:ABC-type Fe3+ transport system permease subunit
MCVTMVILAVAIAAGVATGEPAGANYAPQNRSESLPADLVAVSAGMLAFAAMRVVYVLYRLRRAPNAMYTTRGGGWLTPQQHLRKVTFVALLCVATCCLGLWLRHLEG